MTATGQWSEGEPFSGVQSSFYRSSTTYADSTTSAWVMNSFDGFVQSDGKGNSDRVWPVRGGQ